MSFEPEEQWADLAKGSFSERERGQTRRMPTMEASWLLQVTLLVIMICQTVNLGWSQIRDSSSRR